MKALSFTQITLTVCFLVSLAPEANTQKSLKIDVHKTSYPRAKGDVRVKKTSSSPKFLDAVGRTTLFRKNGSEYHCSGSLIGRSENEDSRIIISSAHCDYSLSKHPVIWMTITREGKVVKRKVIKELFHSAGWDYSVLLLDSKVSHLDVEPLVMDEGKTQVQKLSDEYGGLHYITGHSSDAEFGEDGKVMTYTTGYNVEAVINKEVSGGLNFTELSISNNSGYIEAYSFGGSSGGAIIVEADKGSGKRPHLIGIVQGSAFGDTFYSYNGVGGSNTTKFVMYNAFFEVAHEKMDTYND